MPRAGLCEAAEERPAIGRPTCGPIESGYRVNVTRDPLLPPTRERHHEDGHVFECQAHGHERLVGNEVADGSRLPAAPPRGSDRGGLGIDILRSGDQLGRRCRAPRRQKQIRRTSGVFQEVSPDIREDWGVLGEAPSPSDAGEQMGPDLVDGHSVSSSCNGGPRQVQVCATPAFEARHLVRTIDPHGRRRASG